MVSAFACMIVLHVVACMIVLHVVACMIVLHVVVFTDHFWLKYMELMNSKNKLKHIIWSSNEIIDLLNYLLCLECPLYCTSCTVSGTLGHTMCNSDACFAGYGVKADGTCSGILLLLVVWHTMNNLYQEFLEYMFNEDTFHDHKLTYCWNNNINGWLWFNIYVQLSWMKRMFGAKWEESGK